MKRPSKENVHRAVDLDKNELVTMPHSLWIEIEEYMDYLEAQLLSTGSNIIKYSINHSFGYAVSSTIVDTEYKGTIV